MSLQRCSGTSGFPLRISKNLFTSWDGGFDPSDPAITRQLVVPTDFSVSWATTTMPQDITVDSANAQFKIGGLDNIADATKLIYGSARYSCQPILSVVKIQHRNLVPNSSATQEIIMTFLIKNQESNPSSPHVILLCRPVILVSDSESDSEIGTPFWKAVNSAALNNNSVRVTNYNGSENFTYADRQTLMPMITYETCMPTRLIGGSSSANPMEGSTKIRVHVVTQPLSIPSVSSGTGKCTRVTNFVLPITTPASGLKDKFNRNDYTNIQFANGSATNYPPIPSPISDSLTLFLTSSPEITSWQTGANSVLQTLQYLVPDSFLGKSLSEISEITTIPKARSTNKAYKCYSIDPTTDIVGDNILIDPSTGESLQTTQNKVNLMRSGGDPALAAALAGQAVQKTGILPGDIEEIALIGISTLAALGLLGQFMYAIRFFMNDNSSEGINQLLLFAVYLFGVIALSIGFAVATKKIGNTK